MTEGALKSDVILSQMNGGSSGENIAKIDEEQVSLLVFELESYLFAFRGSQAREILPFMGATWIPGATPSLPGVINIHGDVAAVLDLRQVLGIGKAPQRTEAGFCIMLREGDGRSGILVDKIVDIVEMPTSEIVEVLSTLDERFRRFALSQFAYHSKMVILLDAAQFVGSSGGG